MLLDWPNSSQSLISTEDIASDLSQSEIIRNAVNKGIMNGMDKEAIRANLVDTFGDAAGGLVDQALDPESDAHARSLTKTGDSDAAKKGMRSAFENETSLTGKAGLIDKAKEVGSDVFGGLGGNTEAALTGTTATTTIAGGAAAHVAGKSLAKAAPTSALAPGTGKLLSMGGKLLGGLGAMYALGSELYDFGNGVLNYGNEIGALFGGELNEDNLAKREERARWKNNYLGARSVDKVMEDISSPHQAREVDKAAKPIAIDVNLNVNQNGIEAGIDVEGETKAHKSATNAQLGIMS